MISRRYTTVKKIYKYTSNELKKESPDDELLGIFTEFTETMFFIPEKKETIVLKNNEDVINSKRMVVKTTLLSMVILSAIEDYKRIPRMGEKMKNVEKFVEDSVDETITDSGMTYIDIDDMNNKIKEMLEC